MYTGERGCRADVKRLCLEHAIDLVPLEETDAVQESLYSQYMGRATYPDGSHAYMTFLSEQNAPATGADGGDPTYAERAIAAEQFFHNVGLGEMVPDHYLHDVPGERHLAVEAVDGVELAEEYKQAAWGAPVKDSALTAVDDVGTLQVRRAPQAYVDQIDEEDYLDFAAATLLSGNSDMKGENVMIDSSGNLYGIDLDHAGGDFTAHYETAEPWRESHYERGLRYLEANSRLLELDLDTDEILQHTQEFAQELDPEDAVQGVENSTLSDDPVFTYRDHIQKNIAGFGNGAVPSVRATDL